MKPQSLAQSLWPPSKEKADMQTNSSWKVTFFAFWIAQAVSLFGSGLASFAVVWWMTKSTGSATVLAAASLAGLLPGVLLGPFAGALVDRWDRRIIMMVSDTISALMAAILVALFWSGWIQVWHLYVLIAIRSIAGAFQFPAMSSSTSLMVPKEQLARVAGMNQALQGLSMVATPPLGALLLDLLPLHTIQGIDVITAAIAVGLLFFIAIPRPAAGQTTPTNVLQDMKAGMVYLLRFPALIGIMAMAALLNLVLTPAFSLIPILVTRTFHGAALQLAWINTAYGIGVLGGGILLSVWGGFKHRILTSMLGLAGLGAGTLLIGLAPANGFWIALAGMALVGIMNTLTNGPFMAILQSIVAPEMQGRVFTVLMSISMGMSPIGLAIAGPLADRLGIQVWYLTGTVVCLAMCASVLVVPSLLHMEDHSMGKVQPSTNG
jgi:MFS transporter, DHA3 family, macrolide efflux protein